METTNISDKDVDLMEVASSLYQKGELSLGQAAEFAGVTKRIFVENIGEYGVSVFSSEVSDLQSDFENAKIYKYLDNL